MVTEASRGIGKVQRVFFELQNLLRALLSFVINIRETVALDFSFYIQLQLLRGYTYE